MTEFLGSLESSRGKRKRGANPLPEVEPVTLRLEREFHHELELPHSTSVEVALKTSDLASIAAAIDTGVALRAGKSINGVVEHVVRVHAERAVEPLSELEALGHRHVTSEVTRPMEGITADISVRTASR